MMTIIHDCDDKRRRVVGDSSVSSDSDQEDHPLMGNDDEHSDDADAAMGNVGDVKVNPDSAVELQKIREFKCVPTCAAFKQSRCIKSLTPECVYSTRLDMEEMSDFEKNLIIIGKVSSTMNRSTMTEGTKRRKQKVRKHQYKTNFVEGRQVCRESFEFIHGISQNRLPDASTGTRRMVSHRKL